MKSVVACVLLVVGALAEDNATTLAPETANCMKGCMRDMAAAIKMGNIDNMTPNFRYSFFAGDEAMTVTEMCGFYNSMNACVESCAEANVDAVWMVDNVFEPFNFMCAEKFDQFNMFSECFPSVYGSADMTSACYGDCGDGDYFATMIAGWRENARNMDIVPLFESTANVCTYTTCMLDCRAPQFQKTCNSAEPAQLMRTFIGKFVDAAFNVARRMNIPEKAFPESCVVIAEQATFFEENATAEPIAETTTIMDTTTIIAETTAIIEETTVNEINNNNNEINENDNIENNNEINENNNNNEEIAIEETTTTTTTTMAPTTTTTTTIAPAVIAEIETAVKVEKAEGEFNVDDAVVAVVNDVFVDAEADVVV